MGSVKTESASMESSCGLISVGERTSTCAQDGCLWGSGDMSIISSNWTGDDGTSSGVVTTPVTS